MDVQTYIIIIYVHLVEDDICELLRHRLGKKNGGTEMHSYLITQWKGNMLLLKMLVKFGTQLRENVLYISFRSTF